MPRHSIGFANPALYKIAGEAYAENFNDVTSARPGGMPTTNRFDSTAPYPAEKGYDSGDRAGYAEGRRPGGLALRPRRAHLPHAV